MPEKDRTLDRENLVYYRQIGPISAALKRLKLATVTPGATSTLSASSTSLFLCRCSDAFSSSFTRAAINLQPLSPTVLYQTPGSSAAAVLQFPVMPNSRRSSATQSVHSFSFLPGPRFPAFPSPPDMTLLGNLRSPMRSSAPNHNNLLVRTVVSMLSHRDLHRAPTIRSNILLRWCVVKNVFWVLLMITTTALQYLLLAINTTTCCAVCKISRHVLLEFPSPLSCCLWLAAILFSVVSGYMLLFVVVVCCCCCFSHSAHVANPKKNYYTRWPIPLVVCWNREKKKKKVWQRPPPPARCSFGEKKKKKKKKSRDAFTCLGATQVGVTQVVSVRLASVQGFLRLVSTYICMVISLIQLPSGGVACFVRSSLLLSVTVCVRDERSCIFYQIAHNRA